jgi:hypothetical protein
MVLLVVPVEVVQDLEALHLSQTVEADVLVVLLQLLVKETVVELEEVAMRQVQQVVVAVVVAVLVEMRQVVLVVTEEQQQPIMESL